MFIESSCVKDNLLEVWPSSSPPLSGQSFAFRTVTFFLIRRTVSSIFHKRKNEIMVVSL